MDPRTTNASGVGKHFLGGLVQADVGGHVVEAVLNDLRDVVGSFEHVGYLLKDRSTPLPYESKPHEAVVHTNRIQAKEVDVHGGLLETGLGPRGANELHMQILESGFDVGVVKLALCDIERLLREHDRVRLQLSPHARAGLELAKRQNERVKHTVTERAHTDM